MRSDLLQGSKRTITTYQPEQYVLYWVVLVFG